MNQCHSYKLKDAVEEYCFFLFNDRRKHFINYMRFAKVAWREIFVETLKTVTSEWVCLSAHEHGFKYAEFPATNRIVSIEYLKDGKLVKLYESSEYFASSSTKKQCGCKVNCNCGSLCSSAKTSSLTTKEVVIDNVSYYERVWREMASNGDVIEIRQIPTKQYSTGGSYTITTIEQKSRICNLKLKDCGCVENTKENAASLLIAGMSEEVVQYETGYKILSFSGVSGPTYQSDLLINATEVYLAREGILKKEGDAEDSYEFDPVTGTFTFTPSMSAIERNFVFYKTTAAEKIAVRTPYVTQVGTSEETTDGGACASEVVAEPAFQFSDCGNKINVYNITEDQLFITHQVAQAADDSLVPWEALKALWAGIHYYSVKYNKRYNYTERREAQMDYSNEKLNLVMFENPIDPDFVSTLSNKQKQW